MGLPFYVYMLLCADGSYYVGHTDDMQRRYAEYEASGYCAYTTVRRPVRLVWSQEFSTRDEAKLVEAQVKRWNRAKKVALMRGDWESLRNAAKKDFASYRKRRTQFEPPE